MATQSEATSQELSGRMRHACNLTSSQDTVDGNGARDDYEQNYSLESGARERCPSSGNSSPSESPSSESAFSLASSECDDDSEGQSCSSSPSSGRSSATNKTTPRSDSTGDLSAPAQLNSVVNVAPATRQVRELIDQVRTRFLETAGENIEQYEELDLSEMRKELPESVHEQEQALAFRFITRFINFNDPTKLADDRRQQVLGEAAEKLAEFLKFRHHYQLAHVILDQFCKEIYHLHGIFPFGQDKNQLPILYMRARVHRRWSHSLDETFRRYVAWQVDLMTKSNSSAQVSKTIGRNGIEKDGSFGICFDCLNVSYSCVDMDFLSYLVKILVNYYPTYCRYALCVDLPWLFRSVWKLVKSWLPEDARNTVHLITSKQLTEFIDEDQIPNCIRPSDTERPPSGKHEVPESFESLQGIDQLGASLKLSSAEVKQFKSHVDKVRKEYKQSGAI